MQAVLLAGGKGTRIKGVDDSVPKPLIEVAGRPVLFRQIDQLRDCSKIIVIGGYLGELLRDRLQKEFGDRVEVILEPRPLGTGGCLSLVRDRIHETTLVISGDLVFDVDLARLLAFHRDKKAEVTLAAHPNNHPRDSDLIDAESDGRVRKLLTRPHPPGLRYHNLVNASIAVVEPAVWKLIPDDAVMNLEKDVFTRVRSLWAYRTPEYIKDMGTPDRWKRATADIESGLVESRSLRNRQKAVFLDRDGVLNRHDGYITRPEQLELLPGVTDAILRLNHSPYLAIVVTNQPQVARGMCTLDELDEVTKQLETLLGDARLDDHFVCPHHPDGGFPGEVKALKIKCACRKPEPGMLLDAAARYNIDLSASFMLGDSERDLEAGRRAGATPILVDQDHPLGSAVDQILLDNSSRS